MVFLLPLQGERPVALGRGDTLELQKELDRVLLANYAPAAVLVSDDFELLQSHGDTSPYLKVPDGKPSLNLLKMAREGLGFELRNAAAAVKQQKMPYRKDGIKLKSGDRTRIIRIDVTPLKLPSANEPCFVVVFDEPTSASSSAMQTGRTIYDQPGRSSQSWSPLASSNWRRNSPTPRNISSR